MQYKKAYPNSYGTFNIGWWSRKASHERFNEEIIIQWIAQKQCNTIFKTKNLTSLWTNKYKVVLSRETSTTNELTT